MMDRLQELVKTRPDEKVGIHKNCPSISVTYVTIDSHRVSMDRLPVLSFRLLGREGNPSCQVCNNFVFFSPKPRSDLDGAQISR